MIAREPEKNSVHSAGEFYPPRRLGRYLLFDAIASGGMATVYIGRLMGPSGFSRVVAIKRLHEALARDHKFVAMLLDEARLLARIRHPNVVSVLDVIDLPNELCMVVDYVDGECLARLAFASQETGDMPVSIAAAIMVGVLRGLHAAHEATSETGAPLGIVHRDVSPQNIMVARDGLACVLDFGIAFAADRIQNTTEGQVKGKIGYLAPEQLLGDVADRRADIRAAAVVLWELLAGRKLYQGRTSVQTMRLVLDTTPAPLRDVVPALPPALETIVMKGLSHSPDDRYSTAAQMASAIEAAVDIASHSEVSRWLIGIAGSALDARAAKVARIERYVEEPSHGADVRETLIAREAARPSLVTVPDDHRPVRADSPPVTTRQVDGSLSLHPSGSIALIDSLPRAPFPTEPATDHGVEGTHDARGNQAPSEVGTVNHRTRLWIVSAVAVALTGAAAVVAGTQTRSNAIPLARTPMMHSESATQPSVGPSGGMAAIPVQTATLSASAAVAPSQQAAATNTRKYSPQPARTSAPHPTKVCDNPWMIDKDGIRTLKQECL